MLGIIYGKFERFFLSILAYFLWLSLTIVRGHHRAINIFYKLSQTDRSILGKTVRTFLNGPLRTPFLDYHFYQENKDSDRVPLSLSYLFSGPSLVGYGDIEYKFGPPRLEDQQRGLILPMLKSCIEACQPDVVTEIGTGNGDVVAYLSEHYPDVKFLGIDFNVQNAIAKHGRNEALRFLEGYALDLIEKSGLKSDIVFASSTTVLFTPRELRKYLGTLSKSGVAHIVLNEPTWASYVQRNDASTFSSHLEGEMWFHNYCGYFREAGYSCIQDFQFFHYKHPQSSRSDIYVARIWASLPSASKKGK